MNKIIAITGGIGSGKSFALKIIKKLGYKSFSADLVYKNLQKNKEFIMQISSKLGVLPIEKDGKFYLDKQAISNAVFNDKNKLKILNDFTHPKIMQKMIQRAKKCDGYENLFDFIFVIKRKDEDRFLSASKRDKKTIKQIKIVAKNQFDYTNLTQNTHTFIIENDGDEVALTEKIKVAIQKII